MGLSKRVAIPYRVEGYSAINALSQSIVGFVKPYPQIQDCDENSR